MQLRLGRYHQGLSLLLSLYPVHHWRFQTRRYIWKRIDGRGYVLGAVAPNMRLGLGHCLSVAKWARLPSESLQTHLFTSASQTHSLWACSLQKNKCWLPLLKGCDRWVFCRPLELTFPLSFNEDGEYFPGRICLAHIYRPPSQAFCQLAPDNGEWESGLCRA